MEKGEFIAFLEKTAEFSASEKQLIYDHTELKKFEKGDYLVKFGEVCKNMCFITTGVIRFYILTDEGEELTMMFLSEGEMALRLESFFKNTPSNGFLQCETACELICISKEKWLFLKKKVANFAAALNENASVYMAQKLELQRRLFNQDAINSYLEFVKVNSNIVDRIPMKHLASYLGITPSSLSRLKKDITLS